MGRKSLNQVISGSGLPLAAQSMVAVRVRSTTFSCGPMSMLGKPVGSRSSVGENIAKFRDKQWTVRYQLCTQMFLLSKFLEELTWPGINK